MLANSEISTLTDMLLSGYRLDGRSFSEYREINFRFPQGGESGDGGCCIVKIGATAVMAQVSTEVVEPKHFRPSQGMLFVNFDASILRLHHQFRGKQKRDDEGRRLSAVLQTLLRDSIDLDALCIVAWERVFAVRVELRALSYDGNLGDCGALAAVAALTTFRRPDVYVDANGKVLVDNEAMHHPLVPLSIRRVPVLVTLALTSDAKVVLIDPSAREECILTGGRVLVGLTKFSEICCLYTAGLTVPIQSSSLTRCIRMGNSMCQSLITLLDEVSKSILTHRELSLTAAHARSIELKGLRSGSSLNAPLVFSTADFVIDQLNVQLEEGEVLPDIQRNSDTDMEIASSDAESPEATTTAPERSTTKLLPYGVIEVSSLLKTGKADSKTCKVDFLKAFSSSVGRTSIHSSDSDDEESEITMLHMK